MPAFKYEGCGCGATDSTEDYSARGPWFEPQQWNIPWMAFMDNHISLLSVSSIPL